MEIRRRVVGVVGCWSSSSTNIHLDNEFFREELAATDILFVSGQSGAAAEAELKKQYFNTM